MVDIGAIALSGFAASEKKLAVVANNIANANSEDFKAQDVVQSSIASGGVSARVVERTPATVPTPNRDGGIDHRPNVALDEELVTANIATYSAQANLKVLHIQNALQKNLLDIQA